MNLVEQAFSAAIDAAAAAESQVEVVEQAPALADSGSAADDFAVGYNTVAASQGDDDE